MAEIRRLGPVTEQAHHPPATQSPQVAQATHAVAVPAAPRPAQAYRALDDAASRGRGEVVIDVRDLTKTYADGTHAVQGVSFQVRRGETFGLLGPNGAGKTTTMRILGTLHRATSGEARMLGMDVARAGIAIRQRIGFAMQEVGLDELATAEEHVVLHGRLYGLPRAEAERRAKDLLALFDLEKHAGRIATKFSGGMKRRLDLAVSLVHEPEVLILDEPSAGLDPTSRADLWGVLRRLRREKGLTVLMSTHYMEEADALCDRIAFMNQGRIAAIDTPANLKRSLGGDVVRFRLGAPATQAQLDGLRRQYGPDRVRVQNGTLDLVVPDAGRAMVGALRTVSDAGLRVESAQAVTPTLDDVFVKYTGHTLRDGGEAK